MVTTDLAGMRRPGSLVVARVVLWVQAVLLASAWVVPNGMVGAFVLTEGIPDDGSAGWLLIPVIYLSPLLVAAAPAFVLAARFWRGRQGVFAGVVAFESVLVACGLFGVVGGGAGTPFGVVVVLLGVAGLGGVYVLAAVLRSYLTGSRPPSRLPGCGGCPRSTSRAVRRRASSRTAACSSART